MQTQLDCDVHKKSTGIQFFDAAASVRHGGRPVAADVQMQKEVVRTVSEEFQRVHVVLSVRVRTLYVQLHVPANSAHV